MNQLSSKGEADTRKSQDQKRKINQTTAKSSSSTTQLHKIGEKQQSPPRAKDSNKTAKVVAKINSNGKKHTSSSDKYTNKSVFSQKTGMTDLRTDGTGIEATVKKNIAVNNSDTQSLVSGPSDVTVVTVKKKVSKNIEVQAEVFPILNE